ncbi:carbohydrate ABC transporter permease [Microbacterium sp. EYE_5]|uniref:carbohydrate ABC transporter permease n=1 Tax=unclassified Microbacterium TaxID=2609290 RepID=UPI002005F5F8|nr:MULTISPECIES: carbohydrate ABC transporter permease [unclassified Microbacterium]MCK6080237.1 carbohydrate ABC transporter permease [Microbacterium sp. EYE_382]MCK6085508.1 carbohydrate ABC transporter permease [Microbacterium sp. EYE_384]MCK6122267.1 carbohydrate ABC transporter permease [Microbacterium sp. EYE_80]MCK6126271.1 carbohydrate ABC transporter permease [Microbacterium sp. EYE_79]MCK6141192.1 carbohydrate ABC transporter permease [Microbacterium sp. EYE_39]
MTVTATRTLIAPGSTPTSPRRRRSRAQRVVLGIPSAVFTTALAIIFLYPLIWTAVSSLGPRAGTSQTDGWGFGNYLALADYQAGVWVYLGNSLFVSLLTVALTLLLSLTGGYAFARFSFPGKNVLFLLVLAILMVPYATLLIPLYVLLNAVGLQNSLVGVALVITMFQLPFSMFMMRVSFESVPREFDEAAMVDGCSTFSALWRVLLPAVKPGLITVGLFAFLTAWNDFFAPLILINDSARMTLPLAVANLRGQVQGVVDYGATEAGVVVLALPCILLFLILQRHYVRGFMSGAFKG